MLSYFRYFSSVLILVLATLIVHAQKSKPTLSQEALVNKSQQWEINNPTEFTILIYGSIGCGFSDMLGSHVKVREKDLKR